MPLTRRYDPTPAVDRSKWPPIEERRARIARWQADARLWQLERDRWADDGGAVPRRDELNSFRAERLPDLGAPRLP